MCCVQSQSCEWDAESNTKIELNVFNGRNQNKKPGCIMKLLGINFSTFSCLTRSMRKPNPRLDILEQLQSIYLQRQTAEWYSTNSWKGKTFGNGRSNAETLIEMTTTTITTTYLELIFRYFGLQASLFPQGANGLLIFDTARPPRIFSLTQYCNS